MNSRIVFWFDAAVFLTSLEHIFGKHEDHGVHRVCAWIHRLRFNAAYSGFSWRNTQIEFEIYTAYVKISNILFLSVYFVRLNSNTNGMDFKGAKHRERKC